MERENQQLLQRNRQLSENAVQTDKQFRLLQEQLEQARASVNFPADPPVGTHGYGPIMIALAVSLGMSVGFRGAERAILRSKPPGLEQTWLHYFGLSCFLMLVLYPFMVWMMS